MFAVLRVGEEVFTAGGDGVLVRWDAREGRTLESLPLSGNSLRCLAYLPAHDALAVGASDSRVYVVDRASFAVRHVRPANDPSVFTVAAVPGRDHLLVSGGRDAHLRFHSLTDAPPPPPIAAHLATVNALAFSPDGRHLATASRDKTIKLWAADDFRLLKVGEVVRDRGHVNSVNTLLWLDNRTLVTAGDDRRLLTWSVG